MKGVAFLRLSAALVLVLAASCTLYRSEFTAARDDGTQGVTVRLEYEGAESVARVALTRTIQDLLFELSKDPSRESIAIDAAKTIEDFYKARGFPEADVDYEMTPIRNAAREQTGVRLVIQIAEGQEVVVDRISISGNDNIATDELLKLWNQRLAGVFGLGKPLYVAADIEAFAAAIKARYQASGYMLADVEAPEVTRSQDGESVRLAVAVVEGPLFTIRNVTLDDALSEPIREHLPAAPLGQPFSARIVSEYASAVRARLRDAGYPEPGLRVLPAARRGESEVDVLLQGKPGERVHVAEIAVRGNRKTLASVIRSKLTLAPGDLFNGTAEDRAVREIYRTGLYKEVRPVYEPLEQGRIRLVLEVEELETLHAAIQVGYGSYERIAAGIRLEERNVFGTGRDVAFEAKVHKQGFFLQPSLTDPDLLGSGVALTADARWEHRNRPSFRDEILRGRIAASRRVLGPATARLGYSFASHDGSLVRTVDPAARLAGFEEGTLFAEIGVDTRDTPLTTREGHYERLRLEWANDAFGGDVSFLRGTLASTVFWPVLERWTLVLRGGAGVLFAGDGSANVPVQSRFYNGGENTVRSFRETKLGPRDVNGRPAGGEFRNVFTAEARYEVLAPIELAAFADAGNVGRRAEAYGLSNLRYAVGVGLRYLPPGGLPWFLDLAFNPDRKTGEESWVLHLRVGHPF